jgi:hypothetical protein
MSNEMRRRGMEVGKIGLAHPAAPHDEATMSRTRSRLAMQRRLRQQSSSICSQLHRSRIKNHPGLGKHSFRPAMRPPFEDPHSLQTSS